MHHWPELASHRTWLHQHAVDLLDFGRRTADPAGGARWLDLRGVPDFSRPIFTWNTSRMVHVYGIGALLGVPGCAPIAERALAGLTGRLHDHVNGGWFTSWHDDDPETDGSPDRSVKSCYDHVFVVLAGATGTHAGLPGARALFDDAVAVLLEQFWDDDAGMLRDTWNADFSVAEPYGGINANMHGVEAMLAAASLTGDPAWLERARRVCRFVVTQASANEWRIPEHYDTAWRPVLAYNRDQPNHQFKPYGSTVGHGFEWARLLVHLAASGVADAADWATAGAVGLFDRAAADGWAPDGHPGFVYTVDWDGTPVVRDRLHWVVCEAIGAAAVLHGATGETRYADSYRAWWDHAARYHIDWEHGSWFAQLDETCQPRTSIWAGKADLYHAFQAALIPTLPAYPMIAAALANPA